MLHTDTRDVVQVHRRPGRRNQQNPAIRRRAFTGKSWENHRAGTLESYITPGTRQWGRRGAGNCRRLDEANLVRHRTF